MNVFLNFFSGENRTFNLHKSLLINILYDVFLRFPRAIWGFFINCFLGVWPGFEWGQDEWAISWVGCFSSSPLMSQLSHIRAQWQQYTAAPLTAPRLRLTTPKSQGPLHPKNHRPTQTSPFTPKPHTAKTQVIKMGNFYNTSVRKPCQHGFQAHFFNYLEISNCSDKKRILKNLNKVLKSLSNSESALTPTRAGQLFQKF